MKSGLLKALSLAALFALAACQTSGTISEVDKKFYKGCGTSPPEDPTCGHY